MQQHRKERLQTALDLVVTAEREVSKLKDEAEDASQRFEEFTDEYETMSEIFEYFDNTLDHLHNAIESLEQVFGADGADDSPSLD